MTKEEKKTVRKALALTFLLGGLMVTAINNFVGNVVTGSCENPPIKVMGHHNKLYEIGCRR